MYPAASLVLALAALPAAAQPADTIRPAWSRRFEPALEWVHAVAPTHGAALLVALENGRIDLLDPSSGQSRLAEPVAALPGVRPADGGEPDATSYCFDRYRVYAIATGDRPALRWQVGEPSPRPDSFQGDPEFLPRLLAVHATHDGALVLGDDGRLALLAAADGRVLWEVMLERPSLARLDANGEQAVVLWSRAGRTRLALIRVGPDRPQPQIRDLPGPWPLSAELLGGSAVLAIWPERVGLVYAGGGERSFRPPEPLQAALTGAWYCGGTADGPGGFSAGLVCASGDRPSALRLPGGERLWTGEPLPAAAGSGRAMQVVGAHILLLGECGVAVYDRATGALVARGTGSGTCIGATVIDARVYAIYREEGVQNAVILARTALAAPTTGPAGQNPECRFEVAAPAALRDAVWLKTHVVLVGADGLNAHELP